MLNRSFLSPYSASLFPSVLGLLHSKHKNLPKTSFPSGHKQLLVKQRKIQAKHYRVALMKTLLQLELERLLNRS